VRRSIAILVLGASMIGLSACTGSPSGASFMPSRTSGAQDQGVPILKDQGVPILMDQGVPILR
jgi:hypothetical protein